MHCVHDKLAPTGSPWHPGTSTALAMPAHGAVLRLLWVLLLGPWLTSASHADSPCHQAMVRLCNATVGQGAPCLACEQRNKAALATAGCTGGAGSKLSRFCGGAPSPPSPPRPPPAPPHTADCPRGPAEPCKEPAQPRIESGYESYNLFWPGEQDAEGRVYTCTYCPMITLFNNSRLVALGGCTPSGCPGCNGIHVSDDALRAPAVPRDHMGAACGAACIKTSDNGGRTWTKIRRFADHSVGGMINYDRSTHTILVQHTSRLNTSTASGVIPAGSVVQITSPDGGETWTEPVDISRMLGPLFSPFVSSPADCRLARAQVRPTLVDRACVPAVLSAQFTRWCCAARTATERDQQAPPEPPDLRKAPRRLSVRLRVVQR